jgi:regulator of protease activity HflC (stomatin/prohibitin superfamily)
LVDRGQRGIWRVPLLEGQYYLNTDAYEVTIISTRKKIVHYTMRGGSGSGVDDEREIIVRTSDGFTFPVDVRIEFEIQPQDAPLLVATVGDDSEGLRSVMTSAVRAIFRNNAEGVKALDYVQQRSHQESQSLKMLQGEMGKIGVTITGVRIGDVGDEKTLGSLLKTQTDREIALQEQETFREQQRAAEQRKLLTKTEQEAEEEKRLATASYEVQIAEQRQKQRVIQAEAEAQAIQIQAEAQANAYQLIANQIGSSNAALIELLKIVGERGISITPRVMVVGQGGAGGQNDGQTTALIGTMLDTMVDRTQVTPQQQPTPQPRRQPTTR